MYNLLKGNVFKYFIIIIIVRCHHLALYKHYSTYSIKLYKYTNIQVAHSRINGLICTVLYSQCEPRLANILKPKWFSVSTLMLHTRSPLDRVVAIRGRTAPKPRPSYGEGRGVLGGRVGVEGDLHGRLVPVAEAPPPLAQALYDLEDMLTEGGPDESVEDGVEAAVAEGQALRDLHGYV